MTLREFPTLDKIVSLGINGIVATWKQEIILEVGIIRAMHLVEAAKDSIGVKEGLQMTEKELSILPSNMLSLYIILLR